MFIRVIENKDLEEIKRIHQKFYKDEFDLFNFNERFKTAFVIEEDGQIITAGGIRDILECVAITNKEFSIRKRIGALNKMLLADSHVAKVAGYDAIHAFIQDSEWEQLLIKKGFRQTKGNALILEV